MGEVGQPGAVGFDDEEDGSPVLGLHGGLHGDGDEGAVRAYQFGRSLEDAAADDVVNAQRHRRPATHIPAAGADELIPAGHAGRPHLEQRLVAGQPPRLAHLDHLNPGTHPPNPRYLHLLPLSLLLQAARQPLPGRPAS
jgi:hypothetical protein